MNLRISLVALLIAAVIPATIAWADGPKNDQHDNPQEDNSQLLKVCADPNNLPFSNQAGEGFENHLAQMLAQSMGKQVKYTWWAQRRGFLRSTLNAGLCDVVIGLPTATTQALTTMPYYRSSYVLISRTDRAYHIQSLDDPKLKHLRIGVHLIGNNSPPPALMLAERGIINNVVGYNIYGDYREPNPPLKLIKAVVAGDIDVAIVWGPMAGYSAKHQATALTIVPLTAKTKNVMQFEFSVSLGVRRNDPELKAQLDTILRDKHKQIKALLDDYNVPQVAFHPDQIASGD